MNIIGITDSHDSGAALLKNKTIYAINEERLNRIKLTNDFPNLAINKVLELGDVDPKDVDYVAFNGKYDNYPKTSTYFQHLNLNPKSLFWLPVRYAHEYNKKRSTIKNNKEYTELLKKKFPNAKIVSNIDHHLAHASSAYYTSGWNKTLVLTMDAWGGDSSSTVWQGKDGNLEKIYSSSSLDSVGYMYSRVTAALGYKPTRHEGKITGLAARGQPVPKLLNMFKKMVYFDKKNMQCKTNINGNYIPLVSANSKSPIKQKLATMSLSQFKKAIQQYRPEDVAYAAQHTLENIGREYVTALVDECGETNIALAGGLFANVRLNQVIHEINKIKNIFIHPHMGDGGLGLGNALLVKNKYGEPYNEALKDVYFGPGFTEKYIKDVLEQNHLNFKKYDSVEEEIARLLAKEKIIARFDGKMEYGPRALGNRSILYQATDPTANDWLNKALHRTEFMPFAPVTLKEQSQKCYKNMAGAEYAANFMTITFECTDWLKESCPAIVHLDNTARPQLIEQKINPSYYKILKEYYKITGLPTIVNTSFNMHEEPIVCTPEDAVRSFKSGNLKYLAIGNFIAKIN